MAIIRPRLNDYFDLGFSQEGVDFAIPFLDEDLPLYVDPFLLWKSPSMQDNSLHTALIASFNHLGRIFVQGGQREAVAILIALSECNEVGLGSAIGKRGHRIGVDTAEEILSLFLTVPEIVRGGLQHIEELQLLVDNIGIDRISDITCSLLKSFLADFTIQRCADLGIPTEQVELQDVFDYRTKTLHSETLNLPVNPGDKSPILLVPRRWLRRQPWINFDDYRDTVYVESVGQTSQERAAIVTYNRKNYGVVLQYVQAKERVQADCKNDPLFRPIPVTSAKRKLTKLRGLESGKGGNADKMYEDLVAQLMASLLYPQLDFAAEQSRTDSGSHIRDLLFYNSREADFLKDIYQDFGSRQLVFELKNVRAIERDHVNQLNRYLADHLGRFGVFVTRNAVSRPIKQNLVDLWSSQRKCIVVLTDDDLEVMVQVFETKQRMPIEVLKRAYVDFMRSLPS